MTTKSIGVAQNTAYLIFAYVGQKVFSFLLFVFIARLVAVEDLGKYVFAMSFTSMFGIFIDLGLSQVLIREVAKDITRARDYLNNILSVKAILGVITYLAVVVAINLTGKSAEVRHLVYLSGVVMFLDSFYLSFYGIMRGFCNLKFESIGILIGQVVIFILGLTALLLHLPVIYLVAAVLGGSAFNFFYAFILIEKKLKLGAGFAWDKELLKLLFRIAVPFAIAGIFSRVYGYIDSVLLSVLAGDKQVGFYSAGYKIVFALQFIPAAFAAAIFPAMSRAFVSDRIGLARIFEKSMYYLFVISMPIAAGAFILARDILTKMYGPGFAVAEFSFQILMLSLFFNFISFPLGSMLNAGNRQVKNTVVIGVTMLVNAVLNLILIPVFGAEAYVGASIAALAGSVVMVALSFWWVRGLTEYNAKFLWLGFARTLLATALMSVIIITLKPTMNFLFLVPIGALVYFVVLYLVRGLDRQDIIDVYNSFFKKKAISNAEDPPCDN